MELKKYFIEYLAEKGLKMTKMLSSGHSGFFSYSYPTYDNRVVYTLEELNKLNCEGFTAAEDLGTFIFNVIYRMSLSSESNEPK